MLRSLSTPALIALAALLMAGNAMVGTPLAHAEGDEVLVEPMPNVLPPMAFLGAASKPQLEVDGLTVELERTEAGHLAMVFTNPGDADVEVARPAIVTRTDNIPMGRMGPIPQEVARVDEISLTVPAGETRRFVFASVEVPEVPKPDPELPEGINYDYFLAMVTFDVEFAGQLLALKSA